MKINILSGALGAEIIGLNLDSVNQNNIQALNNLLLEHKVIFFRDQNIDSEKLIYLGSMFGLIEEHAYVKGLDNFPQITRIIKAPDEKNQWGEGWHSDVSYDITPSKIVILKSVKIPPIGGDTVFANMELAWETLDEEIKNIVKDKKALHSSNGSSFFVENYAQMESNGNIGERYSNEHPIVRTHPETGNKILYVNCTYTKKIIGLSDEEGAVLLEKIFRHQERLDLSCRFKWTENAIAILDNRSIQHYAIADFYPNRGLGHERIMDRIAIVGDQPF
ncbi:MAG: TauD/TfdA dioxygenase family protein [Candidatus Pelagibacterales bacterium]|jgi:taurine dioxygenase|tara:strand:- start:6717 stop:7547 length:831 start_codon:yes stop_codon:yes gene_type:complete